MGAFAVHAFVAGVVMLASYIIYKWLLSAENQPAFNRAVLLAIYVLAFVSWPLLGVASDAGLSMAQGDITIGVPTTTVLDAPHDAGLSFTAVLLWIYAAGMIVTAGWTVTVAIRLARLVASGEKIHGTDYTLVLIDEDGIAPFSWRRYVVMSRNEDDEATAMILCHERAHIHCLHFADLLLAQVVCIVLWYNPASWLMLSELKSVHEYQADSQVLSSGINARQYQLLLIKKAVGVRFPSLANSLNHSKLKKRITMMYNRKTSAVRRSRALAIVPAVALALALVSVPSVSRAIDSTASTRLSLGTETSDNSGKVTQNQAEKQENADFNMAQVDVRPEFPGGDMAMFKYLMENITYPEDAAKDSIQGRVNVSFVVTANGSIDDIEVRKSISPSLDKEAIRVVKSMPKWKPGEKGGKKVSCQYMLPITFKLK